MTAFDATVRVIGMEVELPDTDGPQYEQQLILITGALAPVGPNQAIQVPLGVLRIPLDHDSTKAIVEKLEANTLERRPDIQIASSIPEGVQVPGA